MNFAKFLFFLLCISYGLESKKPPPKKVLEICMPPSQLGNWFFSIAAAHGILWDGFDTINLFHTNLFHHEEYKKHFFHKIRFTPSSERVWRKSVVLDTSVNPHDYVPVPSVDRLVLAGYFQNLNYFDHHKDRLLELFSPLKEDMDYIQTKYPWFFETQELCCIHFRNNIQEVGFKTIFFTPDTEYFEKAMAYFPQNTLFVVISDTIEIAKQIMPRTKKIVFIEKEPFWIDFNLLRFAKNLIISNSTFSWWAAYLNPHRDKIIIRPDFWLETHKDIFCPKEWIKVYSTPVNLRYKTVEEWLSSKG